MKISQGTIVGPYHLDRGLPNQDAFDSFFDEESGFTVLAVADGAGSLERSHVGAQTAVLEFGKAVLDVRKDSALTLEEVVEKSFEKVIDIIKDFDDREIGCTLIVFVSDGERWVCASVGDSLGVLQDTDGNLFLLKADIDAEFANQTPLLTSHDVSISFFGDTIDYFSAVALMSDGLENSTISKPDRAPVPGFWNGIFSRNAQGELNVESLLDYMMSSRKLEDDTSLIVANKIVSSSEEESN